MNNAVLFPGNCCQGEGCSTQAPLELLEGEPHPKGVDSVGPECGPDTDVLGFVFQSSIGNTKEKSDLDL